MAGLQPKHIQVCCRIRGSEAGEPTVSSFLNNDGHDGKDTKSYEVVTSSGSFQMDYAFDNGDSQDCIFDRIVTPMLSDAFTGFNCSLFSYGQTGSGKTFTLIGNIAGGGPTVLENKDRGIIPRAAEQIFTKQASLDPQKVTCQVKLAILEVYQEQLKDLIGTGGSSNVNASVNPSNVAGLSQPTLKIREQIDGTVWVEGLTEVVVNTPVDFNKYLMNALKRRVVGAHAMNDTSSRSHFCCIVNVHQVFHATGVKINSKMHFIDLAGSEMVRKTDTTGVRFDEAKHINKSLSALGNVIYALSAPPGKSDIAGGGVSASGGGSTVGTPSAKHGTSAKESAALNPSTTLATANANNAKAHIPYRDSKLTRLLQNSLGGNAKTVIILTISDAKKHLQETLSTLRFGARARQIVIKPVVNKSVLEDQAMLKKQYSKAVQENRHLQDLVAQLQAENHALKHNNNTSGASGNNGARNARSGSESEAEAVCEICNNFLNLKLRNGTKYAPFDDTVDTRGAPHHTHTAANSTNPTNSVNSPGKVKQAMFIDTSAELDTDYSIPEPLDRCAICGLSSSEAEKLQMYTGEALGEMFSCDGNCGHQFHVRCVGLLGEGGQYALPDGEWFCTECYTDNNNPGGGSGVGSAAGTPRASITGQDLPNPILRQFSSSEDLYHTLATDPSALAQQSSRIAPNKTPSSILATIKQEYHTMRKERNRILAQWQQEKRIIEKYEITRRIEQQKRDQELVNAREMIKQLENMVTQGEAQSERMQKLFDIMLKELQQSTASMGNSNNTSNAIRNSADRLKWASLTVETLLEMPIDSVASAARSPHNPLSPHSPSRRGAEGRSPLTHSVSNPSMNTSPKPTNAVKRLANEAVGPYATTSAGIPKPWMGKVRTGAHLAGAGSSAGTSTGFSSGAGQSDSEKSSESAKSESPTHFTTKNSLENVKAPPRYATSTDPSSASTRQAAIAPVRRPSISSVSADQRDLSGGNTVSSIADSDSHSQSRRSSFQSVDSTSTSPDISQASRKKLPENLQQELREGKGKSKFINPLKNRLKDLLKSVEAETDAFAEIRQKFKSREDERNLLRSSQGER